jgi:hypothetical protein
MTKSLSKIWVIACLLFTFGCNKSGDKDANALEKLKVTANEQSTSDELVKSAEQLVGPYSFMLAYKLASMALEKNPANIKAQFYVNLLKRFEVFRGIATRIRPILTEAQIKNLELSLKQIPKSPLKDFLTEKGKDIKTTTDAQNVLSDYFSTIADFRKFLKDNENVEMEINISPILFEQEIRKELADSCKVSENQNAYTIECDYNYIATKKINSADMIALRQAASGELLYGILFNSYSAEGIEKIKSEDNTNEKNINFLFSQPEFGKLRQDNKLNLLLNIGSDLGAALTWAIKYQDKICPQQNNANGTRAGYLFKNGLCLNNQDETTKFLSLLESALKGVIDFDFEINKEVVRTKVDFFAMVRNPVDNLRKIVPTKFEPNGCPSALPDNTLGGTLVNSDASLLLNKNCNN